MPLIRAFGRWLRRKTTDEGSGFSHSGDVYDARPSAMVMSWVLIFVAVLAVVPIVVTGSAYEGVRRLDRTDALGRRGQWVIAVAIAIAIGILLVAFLIRSP